VNAGQIIVLGLCLLLAVWFLLGIWYNRRRAREIVRWLEGGREVLGGRVGKVWIGVTGSGLRVPIDNPSPPFRRLDLIVRLESRENLPLWLFERAQGKRDQLTFLAWLRSPGQCEQEAVPLGSALDRALQTQTDHPWQRTDVPPHWVIAQRGGLSEEQTEALREFITTYDRRLGRFSRRQSEPHLLIQMSLGELSDESSRQLLGHIKTAVTT
jgi:hypothetical protein